MQKLHRIVLPALAAAMTISAAAPAMAYPASSYSQSIRQQINDLQRSVYRQDRHDRISEREAAGLRRDVSRLNDQFRDYNRDGLSRWEARNLQNRIDNIRDRLRHERRDGDHYRR